MTLIEQLIQMREKITSNPRLLISTLLVVLLVWMLIILELADVAQDFENEYITTYRQLTQTKALAREDFWGERKKQSAALLEKVEGRLWPLQNDGLARASLQKELTELAEKAGLERIRIQIEKPIDQKGNKDFKRYRASITSWFKPETLDVFLSAVVKDERQYVFDNFELRFKPFPYFKANLSVIMPQLTPKKGSKEKDGGRL